MVNKQTITQKEWLDFLDLLHNKLRNAKGLKLTQMPALYEISNFMLFRFLDNKDIIGIKISKDDKMKKMYEKYATDEKIKDDLKTPNISDRNCYKLWDEVYNFNNKDKCLLHRYLENEDLLPYLKSSTNKVSAYVNNSKGCVVIQDVLNVLYKKFESIEFDSKFFDMFGSAYEEFKTQACGNGGKQTAQHFTNVYIKKIIINELKPKHNEIFYEPCAGSGGFIHTADHYVLENEGEDKSKIFKKNIFANECNPEIFRPLVLNMLFHNIPLSDKNDQNINEEDSLSNENIMKMKNKCDLIATNFPFGMSTKLEPIEKTKDCWEVLRSGNNYIKNSSGQFILHIHYSLKDKGRTGFVSDRGILNNGTDNKNSWESKLRKFMFENSNVYKIVLLPQGAFSYTNFQTCIIFFKKGEKTKECSIYDAKFKIEKDKSSEMYVEEQPIKTFKIKDLEKTNYDLGLKDEKVEEIKEGFISLGEVVEFIRGKALTIENMIDGQYKVIGGGYICMNTKHNEFNCDENITIMSNDGAYAGFLNKFNEKIFITSHCNKMKVINNNYLHNYIYYLLKINYQNELISRNEGGYQKGQAQPSIDINKMYKNIKIPSLSIQHQEEIIEFLDKQFESYNIEKLTPYTKDIKLFDLLIYKKYDEFADALHIIYRKIEADAIHKKFELDKKAIFNMKVNLVDCVEHKLGDVVETNGGIKFKLEKECSSNNTNKIYLRTQNLNNIKMRNDDFIYLQYENKAFESYKIKKGELYYVLVGNVGVCGICDYDAYMSGNICSIKNIKNNVLKKYLMYYLVFNKPKATGNAQPNISRTVMNNFNIPIPSIADQEKIIGEIEKVESEQSSYANYAKILQEQIDNMNTTIKNICNIKKVDDNKDNSDDEKLNDSSDDEKLNDSSDDEKSDTVVNKKIKKLKKVVKKKVEESSDDEPESKKDKLKKVVKKKESDSESESESDDEENKIQMKNKKKILKKEESENDSENDSESDSDDKIQVKSKKVVKKEESESESESEDEFVWDISVLNKMKKYKDDKDKLSSLRKKNNIPKNIFDDKIKVINKK
jgi:type I restriction-modification system DNA methylase subunit/restriction endonuclease S subunit